MRTPLRHDSLPSVTARCLLSAVVLAPSLAAGIEKVSGGPLGINANGESGLLSISQDGRFIAFDSTAKNLTPNHPGLGAHIFLYDREAATIVCVSLNLDGSPNDPEAPSMCPMVTPDGAYVCFASWQDKLVANDLNHGQDVFVYDRVAGTRELVSVTDAEGPAGALCSFPTISADGRFVVFESDASGMTAGPLDVLPFGDVFVRDRLLGTTRKVSYAAAGAEANGQSRLGIISGDGRYAYFQSTATNLVQVDANGSVSDVFRTDLTTGVIELVSVGVGGAAANGASTLAGIDVVSHDGRFVAFRSTASNLVPGDTNNFADVFVKDMVLGTTTRVSVGAAGVQANQSSDWPVISNDGRYCYFESFATNLVPVNASGVSQDIFVRDLVLGTTTLVSKNEAGVQANGGNAVPAISEDGRFFGFWSSATNLVAGDLNAHGDVFVVSNCWALFDFVPGGVAGSGGIVPQLAGTAGSCVGGYRIEADQTLGQTLALLIAGVAASPTMPFGLLVDLGQPHVLWPILMHGAPGIPGAGSAVFASPSLRGLEGVTLHLQLAVADPAAPGDIALSNGLVLTVSD
jgi:Tol biopolymer transport system component